MRKVFKSLNGNISLPVFFPDATRAVVKTLDSCDIEATGTPGILVNTYHLYKDLGKRVIEKHGGVRPFMGWKGGVISDSGGFQVMTLAKSSGDKNAVTDSGVTFRPTKNSKIHFTPEESIRFQMILRPDMAVVLDDFTPAGSSWEKARETVDRTVLWARRSKDEFLKICNDLELSESDRPYLLGVVQGGDHLDLRRECCERLSEIGFDGFGYGGWPMTDEGFFNYEVAQCIAENTPQGYFLYGLGVGKPQEVAGCVDLGYQIFDCVLPTRDARHKRLYVYNAESIEEVDVESEKFSSYFVPNKEKYYNDDKPVSLACDCLLCTRYSRAYLAHLFRIEESTAMRLSTIHNLRFYAILMDKLREKFGLR